MTPTGPPADTFLARALPTYIARRAATFESHAQAARAWGVRPQYLSDVIRGRRPAGPKLLRALKLRRVVVYSPPAL